MKGAIDGVELGNITPMLANITPAVAHFADYEGDKSSDNEEFVNFLYLLAAMRSAAQQSAFTPG